MLLDNKEEYNIVWQKVYDTFHFAPSSAYSGHSMKNNVPFEFNIPHTVYAIENMNKLQLDINDDVIRNCLVECNKDNGLLWYALDWQHSAFKFNPSKLEEQQDIEIEDKNIPFGWYYAYFPSFYPDGDYYFFIDEKFENGYLGHPWRQEIWVFGEKLLPRIDKIYKKLGWYIIEQS